MDSRQWRRQPTRAVGGWRCSRDSSDFIIQSAAIHTQAFDKNNTAPVQLVLKASWLHVAIRTTGHAFHCSAQQAIACERYVNYPGVNSKDTGSHIFDPRPLTQRIVELKYKEECTEAIRGEVLNDISCPLLKSNVERY